MAPVARTELDCGSREEPLLKWERELLADPALDHELDLDSIGDELMELRRETVERHEP